MAGDGETDASAGLAALLDDLDAVIWEAQAESGDFTVARGRLLATLGFGAEQLLKQPAFWANRIHPEDRDDYLQEKAACVRGRRPTTLEYRVVGADRRIVWVRDCMRPSGDGATLRGVIVDVTPHHWTAEALREAKDRYRELVEEINEVVFTIDESGFITYISPAIESVSGYKQSEVVGRSFSDFVEPEDLPRLTKSFRQAVGGSSEPIEYRLRTKDGSIRWFLSHSRPMRDGLDITGVRGVLTDITRLKEGDG